MNFFRLGAQSAVPMKRSGAILTLTFVALAGGIGFWAGRKSAAGMAAAEKPVEPAIARLRAENAQLRAALQAPVRPASAAAAPPTVDVKPRGKLDLLRAFTDLKKQNLVMVGGPLVFPHDGKITETFVKLFGLSPQEKATLQESIDAGRRRIEALALANTTAEVGKNNVVVATKPFEGGAEIYDAVLDAFAQTLGPERNAAFLAMGADQLGGAFGQFGAEERSVTVTREISPGDKAPMFIVQDQRKFSGGSWSKGSGQSPDVKNLAETYRVLIPYIPQISGLPVTTVPKSK